MRFVLRSKEYRYLTYYSVWDTAQRLTILTTNFEAVAQARVDELNGQKGWLITSPATDR